MPQQGTGPARTKTIHRPAPYKSYHTQATEPVNVAADLLTSPPGIPFPGGQFKSTTEVDKMEKDAEVGRERVIHLYPSRFPRMSD